MNTIKDDLETMCAEDFYYNYFVKSRIWYFETVLNLESFESEIDANDKFKEIVTKNTLIKFNNIQIVGSAKIGFSLNPNKNLKDFSVNPNDDRPSDIDVAIVSPEIFNNIWSDLLDLKQKNVLSKL